MASVKPADLLCWRPSRSNHFIYVENEGKSNDGWGVNGSLHYRSNSDELCVHPQLLSLTADDFRH